MWLVLLISFVIQSSQELDCGMLLENTNFALEGAGDLIAPSSEFGRGSMTRINSENKVERKDCNQEKSHTSSKLKGIKIKLI